MTPEQKKKAQAKRERTIARRYNQKRTEGRRKMARFFEKITQKRDYRGEYVLQRTRRTTAFLDLSDPKHPGYDPSKVAEDEGSMAGIPPEKRVHILVVPNHKREHVGKTLGGTIGKGDLNATLAVVREAEKLAASLQIKNPKVFINSEARIGVGYLHVHIVGERTARTRYPAAMP